MTPNAFVGRTKAPTAAEVALALGPAGAVWDRLLADLADDLGVTGREWKSYSPKHGWALRLMRGKRNVVYLSPCVGSFIVTFILGDRAVRAARADKPSARLLKLLDGAPKYPEGTGVRLDVKSARDLPVVKTLARIKVAN